MLRNIKKFFALYLKSNYKMNQIIKLFICIFITAALLSNTAKAQAIPTLSVSGIVKDDQNKPVAKATVMLLNAKDSSIVRTDIADNDGRFEIVTTKTGSFLLSVSMIGFELRYTEPFDLSDKNIVKEISLKAEAKALQSVTVVTKKPTFEVKADKTVFNVENSINATGSNALELLQKSPGVRVDNNDNISMKGKTGVKIYVDGRMLQIGGEDLASYLKGLNSNDIEAIEMISNPSAKYDASGNAGIINIKLKKNKKYGTNGSATLGYRQGITPKGTAGFNLNYRDKTINIFGNGGLDKGDYHNTQKIYRIQSDTIFDQKAQNISRSQNTNLKVGADYFINKKNTIGVIATIGTNDNTWSNDGYTDIYYKPTNAFQKKLVATNRIPGKRTNFNGNINYRYADTTGWEINADADYGFFRGRANSYQPNYYYSFNGALFQSIINRNNTPTDINIYTAKVDVEKTLKKGKVGFGAKYSNVITKNAFEFFTDNAGVPVKVNERSNRFKYTENVNAAYVNYSRQLSTKWGMQAGLRLEQTNSEGDLKRDDGVVQADNNIKRSYTDLFPSAALSYAASESNQFNLAYSRRIDRPNYQDLNPFENKLDELTYEKGNAFLKPQYTNNIELTHIFKGILTTGLSYSHVKDYRTQILDTTNGNASFVQQRNLATQQIVNLSISSQLPFNKWWNGYVSINTNYQKFKGNITGNAFNRNLVSFGSYMQHTFNLGKDYTAEISGWFNGPGYDGNMRGKSMGAMDIGLQKLFFDKKLNVKAQFTDVLHTVRWRGIADMPGLYADLSGRWEAQTFRLTATYRFGSSNIKEARQRNTGLQSEAGRIK